MPTAKSAEEQYLESTEEDLLDILTERQRFVLELRYGLRDGICYTIREVASLMGVDRKTVWRHEQSAKKRLENARKARPQED